MFICWPTMMSGSILGAVMRIRTALIAVVTLVAAELVAGPAGPAAAVPASCIFEPVFPAKISIGQPVVAPAIGLSTNTGCHPYIFAAGALLTHNGDLVEYQWGDGNPVDAEPIFASRVVPGT